MAAMWMFSIVYDFFAIHDIALEPSMWNFFKVNQKYTFRISIWPRRRNSIFFWNFCMNGKTAQCLNLQDQFLNYVKFVFKVKICTVVQSTEMYMDWVIIFIWQLAFVTCQRACGRSPEWNVNITNVPPCKTSPRQVNSLALLKIDIL